MPTITRRSPRASQTMSSGNKKERMKIYNRARWRELKKLKLDLNPLCEECARVGRVRESKDVHHIVSFMSTTDPIARYRLAYDINNLQSLCKQCHQKKHNSYERR